MNNNNNNNNNNNTLFYIAPDHMVLLMLTSLHFNFRWTKRRYVPCGSDTCCDSTLSKWMFHLLEGQGTDHALWAGRLQMLFAFNVTWKHSHYRLLRQMWLPLLRLDLLCCRGSEPSIIIHCWRYFFKSVAALHGEIWISFQLYNGTQKQRCSASVPNITITGA